MAFSILCFIVAGILLYFLVTSSDAISKKTIITIHYPLSIDVDEINRLSMKDPELIKHIIEHKHKIHDEDKIETFRRINNIIITERGYYCAVYSNTVIKKKKGKKILAKK